MTDLWWFVLGDLKWEKKIRRREERVKKGARQFAWSCGGELSKEKIKSVSRRDAVAQRRAGKDGEEKNRDFC